jgi:hypothetical protein
LENACLSYVKLGLVREAPFNWNFQDSRRAGLLFFEIWFPIVEQDARVLFSSINVSVFPNSAFSLHCRGTDVSEESRHQGYTHCFLATFESPEARVEYLNHPVHVAFAQELRAASEKIIIFPFQTTVVLKASF